MVARSPRQDEVWLVTLDPARGAEIKKARPCFIVSPDEMNEDLRTAMVAPMTTTLRAYPTRVAVTFQGTSAQVALDQLRAVDRERQILVQATDLAVADHVDRAGHRVCGYRHAAGQGLE